MFDSGVDTLTCCRVGTLSAELAGCKTLVTTELAGCKMVVTTGGRNTCSVGTGVTVETLLAAGYVGVMQPMSGVYTANVAGRFEAAMTCACDEHAIGDGQYDCSPGGGGATVETPLAGGSTEELLM